MSINSVELARSVKNKDINGVIAAIKKALEDALSIMKKKSTENSEFNMVKWSNSPSNNADEIVLKSKMKNAISALNQAIEFNKSKYSIANLVANFLIYNDTAISLLQKEQWAGILLDMIIIGCDCQQLNSLNINIIGYLNQSQTTTAKQILSAYNIGAKKFNNKKLLEVKGITLDSGNYQSLAEILPAGTLFKQPHNGPLSNSVDGFDAQKRTLTPDTETALLIDKSNASNNSTDNKNVKSRCCWPFG